MKKKLLLGLSLLGLVTFASCGGKDSKKSSSVETSSIEESSIEVSSEQESNLVEEVSKIGLSEEEPSLESSVESSSEEVSTAKESTPVEGQIILSRSDFQDEVSPISKYPDELGYILVVVDYNTNINGQESKGTWYFEYNPDAEREIDKWDCSDATGNDFKSLLKCSITSRIGNPFSEMTFYKNPYAVKEVEGDTNAYFEWNNEGMLVKFNPVNWSDYGTSTFEFTYLKGIKEL